MNLSGTLVFLIAAACMAQSPGEVLPNGIQLPREWPPRPAAPNGEPPGTPAYLTAPPAVIPINVGRQLFIDDFLIDSTNLKRTYHSAEYHPATPVLQPDRPWERQEKGRNAELWGPGVAVSVYSDGVWYEPREQLFKMFYRIGYTLSTAMAVSRDGVHWEKPKFDTVPETNVVQTVGRGSSTVWLDLDEQVPERRYKMVSSSSHMQPQRLYYSGDGVKWSPEAARSIPCGDRTTVFFNPFRRVWVASIRDAVDERVGRARRYYEAADLESALHWKEGAPGWWIGADRLDGIREDLKTPPQLYNLDAVGYESLMLGAFSIWRGQPEDRSKPNEVLLGFSRDGFHWTRPSRTPFIPVSERYGDWNWANVQSAGGVTLVVGDRLYFYVMGWAGVRGTARPGRGHVGLATLRRDGFASMDGDGQLTTRPVRFEGSHLFVNAKAPKGRLSVEVLDEAGRPVKGFTRRESIPLSVDSTIAQVRWKGGKDLSSLGGRPVRFRFHLENGSLYSFWVSRDDTGASRGFVAAGGPGFDKPYDDVGLGAYKALQQRAP